MSGSRLNLVRVDNLETTEGLDQNASATTYDRFDEVELVTPRGEPAAMAGAPGWVEQDIRYEYVSGAVGSSSKRARHQISLTVDYLDNATRAKLERWQRDRALVKFNPGFGRSTEIAYRPLEGAGSTYPDGTTTLKDLTGRYSLANSGPGGMVWDDDLRVMRGPFSGTNPRRVIPSPFGAVQCYERIKINRHRPGYPTSATEGHGTGDAGWMKAGANSADITFAVGIASTGGYSFGHADCPSALKVTTTSAANRTRTVTASAQWDSGDAEHVYTFAGAGRATLSVWLRGRFSENATLTFAQAGGDSDSLALGGLDFSEWTRVSLSVDSDDWSTGLPSLVFSLSTSATSDNDDFFIGPTVVAQTSGRDSQVTPEWSEYGTSVGGNTTWTSSFRFPSVGSQIVSFYVPDAGLDRQGHGLINTSTGVGNMGVDSSGNAFWHRTAGNALAGPASIVEGAVNTIAAVWDSGGDMRLYSNGVLVYTATFLQRGNAVADADVALYCGSGTSVVDHGTWPLGFLSMRIDGRAYTGDEIAQIDASLRDPVANLISVQARGRKYRIVQIPSTPRNQPGGAQWIGNLVLEEWQYDSNEADITTAEVY